MTPRRHGQTAASAAADRRAFVELTILNSRRALLVAQVKIRGCRCVLCLHALACHGLRCARSAARPHRP